jgi:hypothetical protein
MNCQRNVNSILPTQMPHKFSYIVAIPTIILNHPIYASKVDILCLQILDGDN